VCPFTDGLLDRVFLERPADQGPPQLPTNLVITLTAAAQLHTVLIRDVALAATAPDVMMKGGGNGTMVAPSGPASGTLVVEGSTDLGLTWLPLATGVVNTGDPKHALYRSGQYISLTVPAGSPPVNSVRLSATAGPAGGTSSPAGFQYLSEVSLFE
jgi:hypothetical protein